MKRFYAARIRDVEGDAVVSDAVSEAIRERQQNETVLESKGWKRSKGHIPHTFWVDPLCPTHIHWYTEALRIQEEREREIKEIMES